MGSRRPGGALAPRLIVLLLAAFLLVAGGATLAAAREPSGPVVDIVELEGVLDARSVGYLEDVVATANAENADVVVVTIDSPGGLRVDGQRLQGVVEGSTVPVAVWVGPPGAEAVGAGAALAGAADLLAVAPGARLGPEEPADLAEGTPDQGAAIDADTAVERGVAAFSAPTLPDVLGELDGRAVTIDGTAGTLDIDPVTANVRFNNPGLVAQALSAATSPALAYVLLVGGALTLAFEVFQPGFGVAGVAGLLVLAYAAYGLFVLPVSLPALVALVAGLALLAADLALGRLGLLSVLGTAGVGAGSWWLFTGPEVLRVSGWLVLVATVFAPVFFIGIMTPVLRAQGTQAMAGAERVVGQVGVVRSMLNPEGHVFVGGALWRARAPDELGKVKTGTPVRVTGLNDRLTLDVELADSGDREPAGRS